MGNNPFAGSGNTGGGVTPMEYNASPSQELAALYAAGTNAFGAGGVPGGALPNPYAGAALQN
jgi:hypothetical protein